MQIQNQIIMVGEWLTLIPVSIEGDVFAVYSHFGYNYQSGTYAPDMDVMGCDGNLDYPQNHYFIESDPFENGSSMAAVPI